MNIPHPDEKDLPPEFYYDESRKSQFIISNQTSGEKGIALAVLLGAISDGCCPEWLQFLADFYEIPINPAMLEKTPAKKISVNVSSGEFFNPLTEPFLRKPSKKDVSNWMFGFSTNEPTEKKDNRPALRRGKRSLPRWWTAT